MGGVLFLLLIHLWNVRSLIVHHDMCILLVFEKVPHILVEETSLGRFEYWSLCTMNFKLIPVLTSICHYVLFIYQSKL